MILVAVVAVGCKDRPEPVERRSPDAGPVRDAAPRIDRPAAVDAVLAQGCVGSPIETSTTEEGIASSCDRSEASSGEAIRLRVVRAPDGEVRTVSVHLRGPSPRTPSRMKTALDLVAPLLDTSQQDVAGDLLASAILAPMDPSPADEAGGVWLAASSSIDDEATPWQRSVALEVRFDGARSMPASAGPPATLGELAPSREALLEAVCRDDATMERLIGRPVSAAVDRDDWVTEPTGRWTASDVWRRCVVELSGGHRLAFSVTLDGRWRRVVRVAIELDHGSRKALAAVLDRLGTLFLPDAVQAAAVDVARGRSVEPVADARIEYDEVGSGHRLTITASR
jgi:hypothetical protein